MIVHPKTYKKTIYIIYIHLHTCIFYIHIYFFFFFFSPRWLSGNKSACQAGDVSSIPGLGRSPGEVNANPLQYSCLRNPMDRGAWWATVQGVTKSLTQLSD